MATLSLFFGIVVSMYNEASGRHHIPHIHAAYAEYRASVSFDGHVLAGSFPPKKLMLLRAWLVLHQEDLEADWKLMEDGREMFRIEPLR